MKEALEFVHFNSAVLARRPVWLFSSGPLGDKAEDAKGQDLRTATVPKEISDLRNVVPVREHRVFFGALDPDSLGFAERAIRKLPQRVPRLRPGTSATGRRSTIGPATLRALWLKARPPKKRAPTKPDGPETTPPGAMAQR
jgi:hypothetical protein